MGLWVTGYLDTIYDGDSEGMFSGVSQPVEYFCDQCDEVFSQPDDLKAHRFEKHPVRVPCLMKRGVPLAAIGEVVLRASKNADWEVFDVQECFIDENPIGLDNLAANLSAFQSGRRKITLINKEVTTDYFIDFDIPELSDIKSIDKAFLLVDPSVDVFDIGDIDIFIDNTSKLKTGRGYIDALSHYLYGILAKDQRGRTNLQHDEYVERYNKAVAGLGDISTSIACAVREIARFNANMFENLDDVNRDSVISRAMDWLTSISAENSISSDHQSSKAVVAPEAVVRFPVDQDTERLIWLSQQFADQLIPCEDEIEQLVESAEVAPPDRAKYRAVLVKINLIRGDEERARMHAHRLRNNPAFSATMERIIADRVVT
jgi:hypothetical protein